MLKYVLLFGFVGLLWVIALGLLFGPMYQPQCHWYDYGQPYQESLTSLNCIFLAELNAAFLWIGRNSVELGSAISAGAAIFIARFTFTLKQSTDRLWDAGKKQYELAKRSVAAAADAAAAARAQVSIADRSFRTLERPYVFVSRLEFRTHMSDGTTDVAFPHIVLGLKNYGRTPAIMREYGAEFAFFNLDTEETTYGTENWKGPLSSVIAANDELPDQRLTSIAITADLIENIMRDQTIARAVIRLFYDDVIGDRTHVERFRYIYDRAAAAFVLEDDEGENEG